MRNLPPDMATTAILFHSCGKYVDNPIENICIIINNIVLYVRFKNNDKQDHARVRCRSLCVPGELKIG